MSATPTLNSTVLPAFGLDAVGFEEKEEKFVIPDPLPDYDAILVKNRETLLENIKVLHEYAENISPTTGIPQKVVDSVLMSIKMIRDLKEEVRKITLAQLDAALVKIREKKKANAAAAPQEAPGKKMVLTTMAEKVKAYEDFFASTDEVLVVVGAQNGGEGKSATFLEVKKRPEVTLFTDAIPSNLPSVGYTEDEDEPCSKVVYHLQVTDTALIEGLREKYNARVVLFGRAS